jgi:ribosomal protein S18 acetylase RimI-like enzyme
MRVWRADADEVDAVARLMARFRDHLRKEGPPDQEIRASAERILAENRAQFLLAAADSEPLGVCQLRYRWSVWTTAEDCWLEDLYVVPEGRGRGLGRALVEAALAAARERGCVRIELDVDEDNQAALALYRSCGFRLDSKGPSRALLAGRRL